MRLVLHLCHWQFSILTAQSALFIIPQAGTFMGLSWDSPAAHGSVTGPSTPPGCQAVGGTAGQRWHQQAVGGRAGQQMAELGRGWHYQAADGIARQ